MLSSQTAGSRDGRSGGKGNWKARFGARPDGAPPPTPAYLQPMAFVSHGTLQVQFNTLNLNPNIPEVDTRSPG